MLFLKQSVKIRGANENLFHDRVKGKTAVSIFKTTFYSFKCNPSAITTMFFVPLVDEVFIKTLTI